MKIIVKFVILAVFITAIAACNSGPGQQSEDEHLGKQVFLIGNGPNSKATIREMIEKSGIKKGGYVAIIPTSFTKNDANASFLKQEFYEQEIMAVHIFNFRPHATLKNSDVLAIENAGIICILNGGKNQFMKLANKTRLKGALRNAQENGALIAGIGNGASILCDYYFNQFTDSKTKEKKIALRPGLGLLKNTVVDGFGFLKNNKERIKKRSMGKNFVFIGLNNQAAVWVNDEDAVVLSKAGMTMVYPDKPAKWLTAGDEFSLLPR